MTTSTTYNLLRRGITALALVCISVITFAQEPDPTYVAKIDETHKYETLAAAITAATESPTTITLLADITAEKEETVTVSESQSITLEIGDHTIHSAITNSGALAFSDGTMSGNITNSGTITITGGTFTGTITNNENGTITISGGIFSTVDENFGSYLQSGYAVKANSEDPATYSVVAQTKTEVSESIEEGDAKEAADALAANTAIATTEGLAYNQSLEISINNVTLEDGVVKTATFEVTPKDVNGATIENASISAPITFRLPISNTIAERKWVNLKHDGTPIPASQVVADGDNRYVEVTTSSFSSFEYQVLLNDPVAQIGKTKYETIAEAIAAVSAGAEEATTIVVLKNIETAFEIPAEKKIALSITTYTVSGAISNAGTLAISDGTVSGNITNTGTLNISGGAIEGTITTTAGTISITGGTFTNKPEAGWIADNHEVMVGNGKFVVKVKGTAEAKIVTVVEEVEHPTLYQTITDAIGAVSTEAEEATTIIVLRDIETAFEIPAEKKIALSVTTNTIIAGDIINAGTLTISDGTFTGTITNAEGATMTISGGTFTREITNSGTLTISGGTFTNKPTGYTCPDGKDLIINEAGVYVVTDVTLAEAKIDGNKYLTIDKAIEAAGETATTITLLKDLGESRSIVIPENAKITLNVANEVALTNAITITNNGALTIASDAIHSTITIVRFEATVQIATGVTLDNTSVALSTELSQAKNVLKSQTAGDPTITTYWVEKMFVAAVALTGEPTTEQTTAAKALAGNTSLTADAITGLTANQSLTITVTSVTPSGENVTNATFEVKLIGADGQEVTGATQGITFRLPIKSSVAEGTWVNLWHNSSGIPGATVMGSDNANKYVTVSTTSFSPFSYEIIETPIAQIGETKYASVENAITAVTASLPEATEIILVGTADNVEEAITVTENKNVKLTIGTHTITEAITNNGTLTIADGTIEGTDKTITNTGAGTLTISGTVIISNPVSASDGTLAISGGTLRAAITTNSTAGLIITNGAINGTLSVGGSGTNTISGGEFAEALTATAGTLTISGGTFSKAGDNAIHADGGTINITGGTFNNTTADAITPTPGSINISGGTFTLAPVSTLCVAGYLPLKNDAGKFDVKDRWDIVDDTDLTLNPHLAGGGYSVKTAEYQRHNGMVSAGNAETKYGTICLPFNITAAPTGMTLYKATSIVDNTLTITAVTYEDPIAAGTPLIFELSTAASNMTVTSTDDGGIAVNTTAPATAPVTGNLLVGRYTAQNITSGLESIYYLNGDHFHQAKQNLTVPAFRAYLDITTVVSAPERLHIEKENGITTQLENINTTDMSIVAVYDIQGRNIGRLQSGINIVRLSNGQTVKINKK